MIHLKRIAIFASGNGTNAQRIAEYFAENDHVEISLILANKSSAIVLKRAEKLKIPSMVFSKTDFVQGGKVDLKLNEYKIDFIVLAGFLWLVPDFLIRKYRNRIINIHPALLPNYGGKGMYGNKVHEAVIEAGEKQSGITIHFVNNNYDEGIIVFQAKCDIVKGETTDTLADKIHSLEHKYFPPIIEKILYEHKY
ncbi:MAG: phosphoribosylglycinamide formyltransferase [Chlorobi bacterium]|nr:phosphoribosylglycinamide formyltransferase [Chlorobiota bacterium]